MKMRRALGLGACGLMAALLPGAATAQGTGELAVTAASNATCEYGQGSARALPPCELDESGAVATMSFVDPQSLSGVFSGIQTLYGTYASNSAEMTFEASGTAFFAGSVEGCGAGTAYLDYQGSGLIGADGSYQLRSESYTVIPGGSLDVTGSYERSGSETANGDGTTTTPFSVVTSCAGAPAETAGPVQQDVATSAIATAVDTVAGSRAFAYSRDERDRYLEVSVIDEGRVRVVILDVAGSRVTGRENDGRLDRSDLAMFDAATVELADAIATALASVPGVVLEADLEDPRQSLVWDVRIRDDDGTQTVLVDATTGEIVS